MRRTTFFLSAVIGLFGATTAFAQPANFAGHWVQEVLQGTRAGDGGGDGGGRAGGPPGGGRGAGNPQGAGAFGNDFTLVQDAKTLTVTRIDTQTGDTLTATYNLDGTERKNKALFGGGTQPAEMLSTIKWEAKKLIVTNNGVVDPNAANAGGGNGGGFGNNAGPTTTSIRMNGKQLWVETVRPGTSILTIYNKKK